MAGPEEVVADASVVSKWFLPERDSPEAIALRDAHIDGKVRILSPDLLPFEVLNVIRHKSGVGRGQLAGAARDLFDYQLVLVRPTAEMLSGALERAYESNLTVYDACYLALADAHDCPLVTADGRLLAASTRAITPSGWPTGG